MDRPAGRESSNWDIDLLHSHWYEALNEIGKFLGNVEAIADLNIESLLRGAGLARDSLDACEEALADLQQLLAALKGEGRLSATGALLARVELVRALRARAALSPVDLGQGVEDPLAWRTVMFIIGGPRCGTSGLQRWMARWSDVRTPNTVEVLYPEVTGSSQDSALYSSVTLQDRLWDTIDPNFSSQHLNRGDLPAECLPVMSAGFLSHHWTGCYRLPSYERYIQREGSARALAFHRSFARRIASASDRKVLLFKSPAHSLILDDLIACYPNALFLYIDREPDEVIWSHTRLLSSLRNMRSDYADHEADALAAEGTLSQSYDNISRLVAAGKLHDRNFRVVSYRDLDEELIAVTNAICEWLAIRSPAAVMRSIREGRLERPAQFQRRPSSRKAPRAAQLTRRRAGFLDSVHGLHLA